MVAFAAIGIVSASGASAQQPAAAGAGHDIALRLTVPVSCRMTATAPQIRLSGTTDDGGRIDATVTGHGGLVVDCNTAYAMSLARSPVLALPARVARAAKAGPRRADSRADADVEAQPRFAASDSDASEAASVALAGDLDVLLRVEGRSGAIDSRCVMAAGQDTPFVCHALAGPEDARLPPPRASASLIVTGTLDRALSAARAEGGTAVAGWRSRDDGRRQIGERLTVSLSARH